MAEPLKSFFSVTLVRSLAADIVRVWPSFPSQAFIRDGTAGIEKLELLDRGKLIARALGAYLPQDYGEAIDILLRSLGPEHDTDELAGVGMAPFSYLPHVLFVAERGLDDFDLSMHAQYELTKRFTAEFSVRAFIAKDPERTFAVLLGWTTDANAHVRRLVSEGTRLRLPWARRVAWLDANPERILELLELLKDNPSTSVRRSVANNLNDLGKVHSQQLIATCAAWLESASAERRALVAHALRSAVKRGDFDALRLLGYGEKSYVSVEDVRFEPSRVKIGGRVSMTFVLRSEARKSQNLLIDLAVRFVKANGRAVPKVFKLKKANLPPGGQLELRKTVSMAAHSTRTPYPGTHVVDVVVNGRARPIGSFQVVG